MHLTDLLTVDTVRVALPGETKEAVLDAMFALLEGHESVHDMESVRAAVLERENSMSTGVGKELALPHGKTTGVSGTIAALAVTRVPVPFAAIDDQPIRILFLMVGSPESKSQHVKVLSRISRIMNRDAIRERFLAATSDEELLTILAEGEQALMDA